MGAYLSAPKTNKESLDGGSLELDPSRYGLSCMQGWRKNMEDSHICYNNLKLNEIEEDISIYGVFDGHGGPNVSKWISYNFRRIFLKCIKEASEELTKKNIDKSKNYKLKLIKLTLEKTFLKLDEEMLLTENQEKLKKFSVPTQENEEESDTRENYLYSILNDIISKNISIKAIERDGKRCLQVVYNKDGNPVEEGSGDSATSLTEDGRNNKSASMYDATDSLTKGEEEDDDEDDAEDAEDVGDAEDDDFETVAVGTKEKNKVIENMHESNNNALKKDDASSDCLNGGSNIDVKAVKVEEREEKNEGKVEKKYSSLVEKTDVAGKNSDVKGLQYKGKGEKNKGMDSGLLNLSKDNKNKIKEEDNKEHSDYLDTDESTETNAKRLKKDMNNEYSNSEKEVNEREGKFTNSSEFNKTEKVKSELTYDNLKTLEKETAMDKNNFGEDYDTNNSTNGNISAYDENSLRLYEKGNSSSEEGFAYDETVTNVIDNNISSSNSENNNNNEGEDCNGVYSSDELRLFENYYSNDYEDNIAYSCGSTALVAVILKGYLIVANAGDSRAIVCFNGNSLGMSTDHKPHLQAEEARIKKAGGYISNGRVDGNLNLTRAIGDLHYKRDPFLPQKDQKISAFPEVTCVTLTPDDEFLFLACDGIWDCKDGQDVVGFVKTRLDKFEELNEDDNFVYNKESNADNITPTSATNDNIVFNGNNEDEESSKDTENNLSSQENANAGVNGSVNENTDVKNANEGIKETADAHSDENKTDDNRNGLQENSDEELEVERDGEDETRYHSAPVIERKKLDKFSKLSQICEELCDECLSNNYKENDGIGCDNMTCLIVQYNPFYKIHTEKKFLNIDEIE
ncbi:protein phosphatase 2C [Plasmodium ovale wallikeri]|uniref:protein-serine/threonine phosphatase n=1 Tax=Plasmodium ovale wallikeri TaxID=864142 RepID=A0A1A8YWP7_PLAOA|nr:protein phosphatase 2C [Plasmodium ovale wallikeri]